MYTFCRFRGLLRRFEDPLQLHRKPDGMEYHIYQ